LGAKANGRKAIEMEENFMLSEPENPYKADFGAKMSGLSAENMSYWDVFGEISID